MMVYLSSCLFACILRGWVGGKVTDLSFGHLLGANKLPFHRSSKSVRELVFDVDMGRGKSCYNFSRIFYFAIIYMFF